MPKVRRWLDDVIDDLGGLTYKMKKMSRKKRPPSRSRSRSSHRSSRRSYHKKGGERVVWEFHSVTLNRVPGYGFGIAVSGGRDNPHFSSGDPSIAISDVLKAGPAEGKLFMNDRVLSANGLSLENVEYARAVQVLRDSGPSLTLVVKRRTMLPSGDTLKVTLTKSRKKDDFGIVLGCRLYVREVTNRNVGDRDGLREGDVITRINSTPADGMTLKEAKKMIDATKDRLQLVVRRDNVDSVVKGDHASSNFIDISDSRNHYSAQNLYVQPPTRGEPMASPTMRGDSAVPPQVPPPPPSAVEEQKSNLARMQTRLQEEGPPRPPLPQEGQYEDYSRVDRRNYYDDDPMARRPKLPIPEPRLISFHKEGSVGIRLTGGNEVGIFVTAVHPGSPASLQGLQPGDKILKVNDVEMDGVTREEAVLLLLSLQDQIDLIVQYRKEEYDLTVQQQRGDSFFIKTHFNYENCSKGEMSFRKGDVFHVIDTLYNGMVNSWQVLRIGRNNQETQKGIIPNKSRGEELATAQFNQAKREASQSSEGGKMGFFRRKRNSHRRAKSLSKDHWDDVVFADSVSKFPAYERVVLKHPPFVRPIVLFGPLSDVARDRLIKDSPDKFASPQLEGTEEGGKTCGIIRLSSIREIVQRRKHAVLDLTPSAVERLNYARLYPVVVFLRADSKQSIKELRRGLNRTLHKSSKKLFDQCNKLERHWSHLFTGTIALSSPDSWYTKLREMTDRQQAQPIWVSDSKPDESLSDDFLFPMASRLSYASSPESDLDTGPDHPRSADPSPQRSASPEHRLVRSSSDPSIATQDEIPPSAAGNFGIPSHNGPPPYNTVVSSYKQNHDYSHKRRSQGGDSKYGFSPHSPQFSSPQVSNYSPRSPQNPSGYSAHLSRDTYYNLSPDDSGSVTYHTSQKSTHYMPDGATEEEGVPEVPPKVDRTRKPLHNRSSAQERLFGSNQKSIHSPNFNHSPPPFHQSPDGTTHIHQRTPSSSHPRSNNYEQSSNFDNYVKFSLNAHDDLKSNFLVSNNSPGQKTSHDPYRFTRSTAQPIRTTDDTPPRPNDNSRPAPPPKTNNYKPVPPPKPKHYRPSEPPSYRPAPNGSSRSYSNDYYSQKMYSTTDSYGSQTIPNGTTHHEEDNGGFDSGHGSSLDRNYDNCTQYSGRSPATSPSKAGYYLNVPPPKEQHGLDLVNRDHKGSAFELYRKPEFQPDEDGLDARHEVVAEARGVFGEEGGTLRSEETGVSVIIPPGAIVAGTQHELYFKVCRDTTLLPPMDEEKGERLLSPLVMCGPPGLKFLQPVELRLPHCASVSPTSQGSKFALKVSDTPLGAPAEWENIPGPTDLRTDSVSVLVDHF